MPPSVLKCGQHVTGAKHGHAQRALRCVLVVSRSWRIENKTIGTEESTTNPVHDMPFADENSIQYDDNTDTALFDLHRVNCKTWG